VRGEAKQLRDAMILEAYRTRSCKVVARIFGIAPDTVRKIAWRAGFGQAKAEARAERNAEILAAYPHETAWVIATRYGLTVDTIQALAGQAGIRISEREHSRRLSEAALRAARPAHTVRKRRCGVQAVTL